MTAVKLEILAHESDALSFRTELFECLADDGSSLGGVSTGSGFGSDHIYLRYGDHKAVVRGRDIYQQWVASFDPEAAAEMPVEEFHARP